MPEVTTDERPHRSVSQYNQYYGCPWEYYLSRLAKDDQGQPLWKRPAAWFPQGSAVHKAAEMFEKSHRTMTLEAAQDVFRESYAEEVADYCDKVPNFEFWFPSGRYKAEDDLPRRYDIGLDQVRKYIEYYTVESPGEQPWILPDGEVAAEIPFVMELDNVLVRGYIDLVTDEVIDNKTGNNPGDAFQLAAYKVALMEEYDKEVTHGHYWMGRTGQPTESIDLRDWTKERLTDEFGKLNDDITAERFGPTPDKKKCTFCGVNQHCEFAVF